MVAYHPNCLEIPVTRRSHRTLGAALVAATLLLGACSSSGGDEADDTTTTAADEATTTTTDSTETTEAPDEGDADAQARAESIDLSVSDFPDGWEASPNEDDGEPGALEQCDDATADDSDELAQYQTDDFTLGDLSSGGTLVSFDTKVFVDEEAATAALEPITDEDVLACLSAQVEDAFGLTGEMTPDDVEGQFDVDEAVAASGQFTGDDGSVLNSGILVLRTGDIATAVLVVSTDAEFDASAISDPVDQVAALQAEA